MTHDPISTLLGKTYEDSSQYCIPRSEGVIKGQELPVEEGYYKFVGEIIIKNRNLRLDLYLDNPDDKRLDADDWNGDYKLVWR